MGTQFTRSHKITVPPEYASKPEEFTVEFVSELAGDSSDSSLDVEVIWTSFHLLREGMLERRQEELERDSRTAGFYRSVGEAVFTMTREEFEEAYTGIQSSTEFFEQSFSRLFAAYHKAEMNNLFRKFLAEEEGRDTNYLSREEFSKKYGDPPWEVVNRIFRTANLDFEVNRPEGDGNEVFTAVLTKTSSDAQVAFENLSSGEKILMSLALCLYYSQDHSQLVNYPKVLLLDEIDAPLHPPMTKVVYETIQNELVERLGIKVIMTTHSPSSVAIADEESLYVMRDEGPERLAKTSKDEALTLLTAGIPTLSIDYENRRQVFVESEIDARIYDLIATLLKARLNPPVSITFISTGKRDKRGGSTGEGCQRVIDIVGNLEGAGARNVYGLIDWDRKNNSRDKVLVLAEGKRYSLENCVLDPLPLVLFLFVKESYGPEELGLPADTRIPAVESLTEKQLQHAVDTVLAKVEPHTGLGGEAEGVESVQYLGGLTLNLPSWYLQANGHDLEEAIKAAFAKLKRHQNAGSLMSQVVETVVRNYPDYTPEVIVTALRKIQG